MQFYLGIFLASLMTLFGIFLFGFLNLRYPKSVGLFQGVSAGMLLAVVFGIITEGTKILEGAFDTSYILIFVIAMTSGAML